MRRDFEGAADLRAMQLLAQRIWSETSRFHIGDLGWDRGQWPRGRKQWTTALWETDGQLRAWGWLDGPGQLELLVDPAFPELADEVLDWALAETSGALAVNVLDTQRRLVEALERRGLAVADDDAHFLLNSRSLASVPEQPVLPPGFAARAVRPEDSAARLAVHVAAWRELSGAMTAERFAAVTAGWPYDRAFDWVVEAPDGRFAAYCMGWYDAVNRCGEFEPVGTDPEFRRRGFARAASIGALRAFQAAGGTTALVYCRGDEGYPNPQRLYRSLGFSPCARVLTYRMAGW